MRQHKKTHLQVVKYIKGTLEFVLWYSRGEDFTLITYKNVDWVAGIILGANFSPWAIFRGFYPKKDSPFCIF